MNLQSALTALIWRTSSVSPLDWTTFCGREIGNVDSNCYMSGFGRAWNADGRPARHETSPPPKPERQPIVGTVAVGEEPIPLGGERLGPEERRRRVQDHNCFYCGQQGHHVSNCPTRPPHTSRPSTHMGNCEPEPSTKHQEQSKIESRSCTPKRLELEGDIFGQARTGSPYSCTGGLGGR